MNYGKKIYSILLTITIILSFSSCQNQNDNIDVLYTNSSAQISSSGDNNEMTSSTSIDNESNSLDFEEAYLIGIWQINDVHMAAGFDDTIRFSKDGEFFYVPNTMTLSNRLVASKGKWRFDKKTNQVTLFYNQQLVIEGGVFQPEDDLDHEAYKGGKPVFKDCSEVEQYTVGLETVDIGDVYTLINEYKYYFMGQDSEEMKYLQDLFDGKIKIYENNDIHENKEDAILALTNASTNSPALTPSSMVTPEILPADQSDNTLFDQESSFVEQYNTYIEKLPLDDPKSISRAIYKFKLNIFIDKKTNDSMFRRLKELYDTVLEKNSDIIVNGEEIYRWDELYDALKLDYYSDIDLNNLNDLYLIENAEFRVWLAEILSNGYYLTGGEENSIWVDEEDGFLFGNFKECLSDGMIEYEELKSRFVTTESLCYNGYYINDDLPLTELSNMIIELENYIDKYPEYIEEISKTQEELNTCLQLYLIGDIYAQVHNENLYEKIDYEDDSVVSWRLNDNTLKSLENFLIEYPSSKYSLVIKEYLEILHDNDQKFSIEAEKFIEDQGISIPWS